MPARISCNWLKKESKKNYKQPLSIWPNCHVRLSSIHYVTYSRIQSSCEHSRCGTAAGKESCTVCSNAGKLCGFPSSHCSAFPAPGGASCGSWTCRREDAHTEPRNVTLIRRKRSVISPLVFLVKHNRLKDIYLRDTGGCNLILTTPSCIRIK